MAFQGSFATFLVRIPHRTARLGTASWWSAHGLVSTHSRSAPASRIAVLCMELDDAAVTINFFRRECSARQSRHQLHDGGSQRSMHGACFQVDCRAHSQNYGRLQGSLPLQVLQAGTHRGTRIRAVASAVLWCECSRPGLQSGCTSASTSGIARKRLCLSKRCWQAMLRGNGSPELMAGCPVMSSWLEALMASDGHVGLVLLVPQAPAAKPESAAVVSNLAPNNVIVGDTVFCFI